MSIKPASAPVNKKGQQSLLVVCTTPKSSNIIRRRRFQRRNSKTPQMLQQECRQASIKSNPWFIQNYAIEEDIDRRLAKILLKMKTKAGEVNDDDNDDEKSLGLMKETLNLISYQSLYGLQHHRSKRMAQHFKK